MGSLLNRGHILSSPKFVQSRMGSLLNRGHIHSQSSSSLEWEVYLTGDTYLARQSSSSSGSRSRRPLLKDVLSVLPGQLGQRINYLSIRFNFQLSMKHVLRANTQYRIFIVYEARRAHHVLHAFHLHPKIIFALVHPWFVFSSDNKCFVFVVISYRSLEYLNIDTRVLQVVFGVYSVGIIVFPTTRI